MKHAVFVFASLLLAVGCHKSDRLETFSVSGVVKVDGISESGVVLQLVPCEGNPIANTRLRPGAVSQDGGKFEFTTFSTGDGAPEGDYKLILFWPPEQSNTSFNPNTNQKNHSGPPDIFDGRYFDVKKTTWSVSIKREANDIGTIEIDAAN